MVALAVELEDDEDEYDFAREIHLWNRSIPLSAARRLATMSAPKTTLSIARQ